MCFPGAPQARWMDPPSSTTWWTARWLWPRSSSRQAGCDPLALECPPASAVKGAWSSAETRLQLCGCLRTTFRLPRQVGSVAWGSQQRVCMHSCTQVRNSSSTEFGLYCATKPTIEHSSDLRFTCWMGAYPGLTEHFDKANLDPKSNQWNKVRPPGCCMRGSFARLDLELASPCHHMTIRLMHVTSGNVRLPLSGTCHRPQTVPASARQFIWAALPVDLYYPCRRRCCCLWARILPTPTSALARPHTETINSNIVHVWCQYAHTWLCIEDAKVCRCMT